MKIIIKTPNFIGDTIMTLPAIELLKKEYPDALITIVCKPSSKDIFRGKDVDKIIIDDSKIQKKDRVKRTAKLIRKIREEKYDLGVVFHNTFMDAFVFKCSRINTLIGYEKENRKIFLDFWLKIDRTKHYVKHYVNLINKYLGDKYTYLPKMELNYDKSKLLQKTKKTSIGFVFGGDNKKTRQYPQVLSLELFELLKDRDIDIVLLGDKDDSEVNEVYETYLTSINKNVINLSGKTSVSEFIDAIASLDMLVTIDTSAMHIAAGVGTKFLVLVGKGTSSFDTVYPDVEFGDFIYRGKELIKDEDIIKAISPKEIVQYISLLKPKEKLL